MFWGVDYEVRACLGVHRTEITMGCGFGVSGFCSPSHAEGGRSASCQSRSRKVVALLLGPLEEGPRSWNPFLQSPQMPIKVLLGRQHSFRSYRRLCDVARLRAAKGCGCRIIRTSKVEEVSCSLRLLWSYYYNEYGQHNISFLVFQQGS